MNTLTSQLAHYAAYHRNPRNVATHCVGIPLIILGLDVLLSRPVITTLGAVNVSPALLLSLLFSAYYLRAQWQFGAIVTLWLLIFVAIAQVIAAVSVTLWLAGGIGLFVVGWILQFIGHYYEGRKPAFLDDIRGLLIGPGFIALEICHKLGFFKSLSAQVEREVQH